MKQGSYCAHTHTHTHACTHNNLLHSTDIAVPKENCVFIADALSKSICAVKILETMPSYRYLMYFIAVAVMAVQTNGKHVLMHRAEAHCSKD